MRGKLHTLYSASARKTQKIAQKLAQKIIKSKFRQKNALIIGLQGELGSGKTTFIQGFAKEFGVKRHITSPTFLIIRSYKLKAISYKLLYHIDTYRIEKIKELNNLDFKKIIADPTNVVLNTMPPCKICVNSLSLKCVYFFDVEYDINCRNNRRK